VSDRTADRPVPPLARASARKRTYTDNGTNDGTSTERRTTPRGGTLGGSNRMLSTRDVAAILSIPERTVRGKWLEWELPAYKIGKHLRWRERDRSQSSSLANSGVNRRTRPRPEIGTGVAGIRGRAGLQAGAMRYQPNDNHAQGAYAAARPGCGKHLTAEGRPSPPGLIAAPCRTSPGRDRS